MARMVDQRVTFDSRKQRTLSRTGFILLPRFLTVGGLRFLRTRVDRIYSERDPSAVDGEWILNVHQILPRDRNWMWDLATDPLVVQMLESTLGPGPLLYASQLHRKAPSSAAEPGGHAVPWHQDGSDKVRTLWISLDEVDEHNGGLRVLPGWHTLGRLPLKRVCSVEELEAAEYMARNNVFEVDLDAARAAAANTRQASVVSYRLPAGGAAMHHPQLPHSSLPNTSARRDRRVIILRFMARGEKPVPGKAMHWRGKHLFHKEAFPVYAGAPAPPTARLFDVPDAHEEQAEEL